MHTQTTEQRLNLAVTQQQAGQLQDAERGYLAILQADPLHPVANHNMGVLAVQQNRADASLPYFVAALQADPACGHYWLSYIDGLFQAGQLEEARQVMELARQQGLQGPKVEELARRLGGEVAAGQPVRPERRAGPGNQEIDALVVLFGQGRYSEVAGLARLMTERYPEHEFGWKALGAVYKQMGQNEQALIPMQKAAALSPEDVEAHYNLGVVLQESGRLDEAQASCRQALRINPDYADAHGNLGVILQKSGRLLEAEASFRQALQINPAYAAAHCNLGNVLNDLGCFKEAAASLRRALQITPDNAEMHCNLGNILKEMGRLDEAEAAFRCALQINVDHADACFGLGKTLKELGRLDEAEVAYRQAIRLKPDNAPAHYNLGNLLKDRDRLDEAEACYRQALQIEPGFALAHYNLGNISQDKGRLDEAEACYREAIQLKPDYLDAHNNLAVTLVQMERLGEAEASYRQVLQIKPDYVEALCNLGNTLRKMDRFAEAETCYRQTLLIKPDYVEAYNNLGITLHAMGRSDDACVIYRQALQIDPDSVEMYNNLGNALSGVNRLQDACDCYQRALQLKPDYAPAHNNLGLALHGLGRLSDAEAIFRSAILIDPNDADALTNLGMTLYTMGRLAEAEAALKNALNIRPDYAEALCTLGNTQLGMGKQLDATASYRAALRVKPNFAMANSNLIFTMDLMTDIDTVSLQGERKRWNAAHAVHLHQKRIHTNIADPTRRLRIGYISADFRVHSAAFVFGGMLIYFDRGEFEVFAYSNSNKEDVLTCEFQQSVTGWRNIAGLSDDAMADLIRQDEIDILVDLSGHSSGNRLLVFARKPAPIQITAWGYATGTGMSAMDVFFSDPVFVPPEEKQFYAEQVIYLPSAFGYFHNHTPPEVNALPALSTKGVTFGSFNRLEKNSAQAYDAWAKILRSLPDSRMIIKTHALDDAGMRAQVTGYFTCAGIAPERIILLGSSSRDAHMASFNQIDIALDPFPHGGGVTALEGMMMGVPMVTIRWPTLIGRVSSSILTTMDLTDWIAETPEQYVNLAIQKAADLGALADLRQQLRGALTSSIICDQLAYTRAVEKEYRQLWQAWCLSGEGRAV